MPVRIVKARSPGEIEAVKALVWEFFDFLRTRYPDMTVEIDAYIAHQNVSGELARFGDFFLPPNGECFLALHDGQPAGIVMLKPKGERDGEMNRMYVRESARGLGLGRALGRALVAEARELRLRTVWLNALYRHVEAIPLYESLGFARYSDPDAFGGDDQRVVHMKLDLGAREG
jgi:GNAT superfamily N-acetyltransferase